jgi:hypothetical protein
MRFDGLSPEERSALRRELEFIDETALNSALENLDEIVEEAGFFRGREDIVRF